MAKSTPIPAARPAEPLIQVRGVSKVYRRKREEVWALRAVDLGIFQGEYLSIMGPSGSGKSTLFNIVGALDRPSAGSVSIGPLDLTQLSSAKLSFVRCNYIGYVFQAYNLIPALTALKNVALPQVLRGETPERADAAAAECLARVGLSHRLEHRPGELSGGQQQRVAIARALVNEPAIILADEPTANLDLKTGAEIIEILKGLSVEQGVTIVTATHDHKMLANSDRVVYMKEGQVERTILRADLEIEEGHIIVAGEAMST
jgi:putative ABC transport system ATP-binding protein